MSRIKIIRKGPITHVVLTRADKKNAMDDEMIDALIAAGGEIAVSDTRGVILSGEGDCFCAGIDLSGLTKIMGQDIDTLLLTRTHGNGTTNRWQEVAMVWHRLEVPVIAVLHGAVFGAGMQLALGADFRIAAPDTQLAVMEMKWGIIPDMGGFVLLPRLVRADVMKQLIYTATPIAATQAAQWGLVTDVAEDPMQHAEALAETLSKQGPNALRTAKQMCDFAYQASAEEVLLAEARAQASLLGKPEQMEIIAARFAGRDPNFES